MFVPGKPFQPNLMFAGKAGAYLNEAPFINKIVNIRTVDKMVNENYVNISQQNDC